MSLREFLKGNRIITDGAMGTYFASQFQKDCTSEEANLEDAALIKDIHISYIKAGADLIRTNTFMASAIDTGYDKEKSEAIIRSACALARDAVKEAGRKVYIAGDIGPIRDNATYTEQEIISEYCRMVDIFLEEQVDCLVFETFADYYYLDKVVAYVRSKSDVYIITDFSLNKNGYTASGVSAARIIEHAKNTVGIDACGFNCGIGSGHMKNILQKLQLPAELAIVAMPNAGYPEQIRNRMVFVNNVRYFAENMRDIAGEGVSIMGGCCGTTPEYIKMLADSLDKGRIQVKNEPVDEVEKVSRKATPNAFMDKLRSGRKVIAVELDPPFDAEYDKLIEYGHILKKQGVDVITMADSPMGRSRVDSVLMGIKMRDETGMSIMPHMCCRDKNMIAMRSTLLGAYINGMRNLLLVTGDPVPSISRPSVTGVFDYNSIKLMNFVKEMNLEHFKGDEFYYGGALNVALGKPDKIAERMYKKMEAGASYFLTQPVYSDEDIDRLRQLKAMTGAKILCGIMPLVSYKNANFMKNEFIGINVPQEIIDRYSPDMTRQEGEEVAAKVAGEIITKLGDAADGYYFMFPFNRVGLMEKIMPYIS